MLITQYKWFYKIRKSVKKNSNPFKLGEAYQPTLGGGGDPLLAYCDFQKYVCTEFSESLVTK